MDTTERLVINLPKELVDKLREHVASGEFKSESHVVETVLKASYYVDDELSAEELEEVRAAVAEGIADADAGRLIPAEEVYANLRARIKAVAEKAK
jgi:antitoxin ParD1/3/4